LSKQFVYLSALNVTFTLRNVVKTDYDLKRCFESLETTCLSNRPL